MTLKHALPMSGPPKTEEPAKPLLERIANLERCNTLHAAAVDSLRRQVKELQDIIGEKP